MKATMFVLFCPLDYEKKVLAFLFHAPSLVPHSWFPLVTLHIILYLVVTTCGKAEDWAFSFALLCFVFYFFCFVLNFTLFVT